MKSKGGDADSSTKMVNMRGAASTEERSAKQKVKLEGRDLASLTAPPEGEGIVELPETGLKQPRG